MDLTAMQMFASTVLQSTLVIWEMLIPKTLINSSVICITNLQQQQSH